MMQSTIENALTNMLGRSVTMQKLKVNPLSGSIEIADLRVGVDEAKIARIASQIFMGKILKKQLSIKSLEIHGATIRLGNEKFKPPAKDSSWLAEASEISVRESAVYLAHYGISLEGITADLRADKTDMRFEIEIAQVKLNARPLNSAPIKLTGTLDSGSDLLAAISAKVQLGIQTQIDLKALLQTPQSVNQL